MQSVIIQMKYYFQMVVEKENQKKKSNLKSKLLNLLKKLKVITNNKITTHIKYHLTQSRNT